MSSNTGCIIPRNIVLPYQLFGILGLAPQYSQNDHFQEKVVKVQIVTVEFAVDLGSGLSGGKPTVLCL